MSKSSIDYYNSSESFESSNKPQQLHGSPEVKKHISDLSQIHNSINNRLRSLLLAATLIIPSTLSATGCSEYEKQQFKSELAEKMQAIASNLQQEELPQPREITINDKVAGGILNCYHPFGDYKRFEVLDHHTEQRGSEHHTRIRFTIDWEGGFTETSYTTTVILEVIQDLQRKIIKVRTSIIKDECPLKTTCETDEWQLKDLNDLE